MALALAAADDGLMPLAHLRGFACVNCGTQTNLVPLPGSLWPNARACAACLARWGLASLAHRADQKLAAAVRAPGASCLHCGAPVLVDAEGRAAVWCSRCETERKGIEHGG